MDHLLLSWFLIIGPPRALGRPDEKDENFRPVGALRHYADNDAWWGELTRLAQAARFVVFVFDQTVADPSKGLHSELHFIAATPDVSRKTVFFVHPRETTPRNQAVWRLVFVALGIDPQVTNDAIVTLALNAEGRWVTTATRRGTSTSVLLSLRHAFSQMAEHAALAKNGPMV